MSDFGGSQRMETRVVSRSIAATTHAGTRTQSSDSLSAQDNTLCFERTPETPCLFGELRSTELTAKKASSAPSSGTNRASRRPSLSDRLTPSLIFAGLVRGTTPLSIRRQLGAHIRDGALFELAGSDAAPPKKD